MGSASTRVIALALGLGAFAFGTTAVRADAVIYNTGDINTATVAMGIFDEGHLNVTDPFGALTTSNAAAVGLAKKIR